jgi:hypothetical protein
MLNMNIETDEKTAAIELSQTVIETSRDINNTLTTAGVRAHYQAHYANAQLDICGILALVKDILRASQAEFPRGIETTELRKIAVAASMFTSEILAEVEKRFAAGGLRYKIQAVKNVLSTYGKDEIGKITLTNSEDKPRDCAKPRCKWYLIQVKGQ